MRIALLTYSTKPRGGVVHTLALAEALAAAGQQVEVWSLARGGDNGFFRPVDPAVTLRLVEFADVEGETVGERILRSIAVLGKAFTPARYDIVHAQDCISANAVQRCIRTIHHLDSFSTPELIACHERAIRHPYAHLCVSAAVAEEVRAGWGIVPTVIGNGIDAARFAAAATAETERRRATWTEQLGDYVLSVGGIEPRKGTDDLVLAMARVQAVRPDLGLVVGGGETLFDYRDYRDRVLGLAAEHNVRLQVLGPVEHDRLPALMAAATVFAFPSRKEGFGLAAMEAMAAGVPVVMRDLPVLREVFGDAARFATEPATMAEQLLAAAGDDSRQRAGQALAAAHRWSDVAEQHLDFYRSNPTAESTS
jgi:glycosyltransferase-like protein